MPCRGVDASLFGWLTRHPGSTGNLDIRHTPMVLETSGREGEWKDQTADVRLLLPQLTLGRGIVGPRRWYRSRGRRSVLSSDAGLRNRTKTHQTVKQQLKETARRSVLRELCAWPAEKTRNDS